MLEFNKQLWRWEYENMRMRMKMRNARDDTSCYNGQKCVAHSWRKLWIVIFSWKMFIHGKYTVSEENKSKACTRRNANIAKKTIAINYFEYLFEKIKIQECRCKFSWVFDPPRYFAMILCWVFFFHSVLQHQNGSRIIKHKLRPSGDIIHKMYGNSLQFRKNAFDELWWDHCAWCTSKAKTSAFAAAFAREREKKEIQKKL